MLALRHAVAAGGVVRAGDVVVGSDRRVRSHALDGRRARRARRAAARLIALAGGDFVVRGALRGGDRRRCCAAASGRVALELAPAVGAGRAAAAARGAASTSWSSGRGGPRVAARGLELLSPASERSGGIVVTVRAPVAVALALASGARTARAATAPARRRRVIVRLALLGGDAVLDDELRAALADLPGVALLAPAHAADADMLLAADSSLAAAGDLVRGERSRRAGRAHAAGRAGRRRARRAQQALDCGAVGVVERPLDAAGAAPCAGGGRLLRRRARGAGRRGRGPRRAARRRRRHGHDHVRRRARGSACERSFVLDLALATGDAAEVAAARVLGAGRAAADRLRARRRARGARRGARAGRRRAACCRRPRCPSTPTSSTSTASRACSISRVASGLRAIVDCGARLGVETIPVLERAASIAIVASADARGVAGRPTASLLLARLGLAGRALGIVVTRARNPRAAQRDRRAGGLPLLAAVKPDARVPRARERGLPPPAGAFAALAGSAARPPA